MSTLQETERREEQKHLENIRKIKEVPMETKKQKTTFIHSTINNGIVYEEEVKNNETSNTDPSKKRKVSYEGYYTKSYDVDGINNLLRMKFMFGVITTLSTTAIIVLLIAVYLLSNQLSVMNGIVESLELEIIDQESLNQSNLKIIQQNEDIAVNKINELENLVNTQDTIINEYANRNELYDEYGYAMIIDYNQQRTDLTYDELEFLIAESEDVGINPHLVLNQIEYESSYTRDAASSLSTARGYNQIIESTGNELWTKHMGRENYNHDFQYDGKTNIEMSIFYLDYLLDMNYNNIREALIDYNGGEQKERYYEIIAGKLYNNTGLTIYDLQVEYNAYKS